MCKTWWRSRTLPEEARKGVVLEGLSMEEEVALVCQLMEAGAAASPGDLVEALGVENSHIGQIWKGVLPLPNRPL